jgi:hypothetical protein
MSSLIIHGTTFAGPKIGQNAGITPGDVPVDTAGNPLTAPYFSVSGTLSATSGSLVQPFPLDVNSTYSLQINIVGQSTDPSPADRISFTHNQVVAYRSGLGSATLVGMPTMTEVKDGADANLLSTSITVFGNNVLLSIDRNTAVLEYDIKFTAFFSVINN